MTLSAFVSQFLSETVLAATVLSVLGLFTTIWTSHVTNRRLIGGLALLEGIGAAVGLLLCFVWPANLVWGIPTFPSLISALVQTWRYVRLGNADLDPAGDRRNHVGNDYYPNIHLGNDYSPNLRALSAPVLQRVSASAEHAAATATRQLPAAPPNDRAVLADPTPTHPLPIPQPEPASPVDPWPAIRDLTASWPPPPQPEPQRPPAGDDAPAIAQETMTQPLQTPDAAPEPARSTSHAPAVPAHAEPSPATEPEPVDEHDLQADAEPTQATEPEPVDEHDVPDGRPRRRRRRGLRRRHADAAPTDNATGADLPLAHFYTSATGPALLVDDAGADLPPTPAADIPQPAPVDADTTFPDFDIDPALADVFDERDLDTDPEVY